VVLSRKRVRRELIVLEDDEFGEPRTVALQAEIALARCGHCKRRWRLLPADILPYKRYSSAVIESTTARYARGQESLRQIAWSLLGIRTPSHTSLHGWSEGLGAHILARPGGQASGAPASRFIAEAEARNPSLAEVMCAEVVVDPRRYRSVPRCERLAALARILILVRLVALRPHPAAIASSRILALRWTGLSLLVFPSRLLCTAIERRDRLAGSRSRPSSDGSRDRCPIRTRSPPGASSKLPR
jgi:hypothetical protein